MTEKLAICGGAPVRKELLPYGHQWLDESDSSAVVKVLKGDWITQGPLIDQFERHVADYCGARYAVAVSNGTAALHAACAIAGISPGDEAITTPLTFAATANAVVYCGGKPVLADIQPDTLNIDPEEIEKRVTPCTKAILPVDFTGHPAALDEIRDIAKAHHLAVIEDAAHALGAEYKGRKVGGLSDMTILSFHPVKHITTGEGGMVLTNNKKFYEKLKIFRHHGIVKDSLKLTTNEGSWYYEIQELGYNLRITDFQCALGLSQMERLDAFVSRRREIAAQYTEAFSKLPEIIVPRGAEGVKAVYHVYVIQLRTELLRVGRREVFEALRAENIGVNVHYVPVHYHPLYQRRFGYRRGDYPNAEHYYDRAITLPIFPKMTNQDTQDVIKAVIKVLSYYRA
jgi:UDP-4-amino-4,6-dideoxy-N-acetyl-beta-L-altrosamine transaminase